jgi:hypothetical protein
LPGAGAGGQDQALPEAHFLLEDGAVDGENGLVLAQGAIIGRNGKQCDITWQVADGEASQLQPGGLDNPAPDLEIGIVTSAIGGEDHEMVAPFIERGKIERGIVGATARMALRHLVMAKQRRYFWRVSALLQALSVDFAKHDVLVLFLNMDCSGIAVSKR